MWSLEAEAWLALEPLDEAAEASIGIEIADESGVTDDELKCDCNICEFTSFYYLKYIQEKHKIWVFNGMLLLDFKVLNFFFKKLIKFI